jgi:hypothetical protein
MITIHMILKIEGLLRSMQQAQSLKAEGEYLGGEGQRKGRLFVGSQGEMKFI